MAERARPSLLRELADAVDRGEPVVVATVIRTRRSVPRRPGAKMLVFADGRISGSIGGGEMEARVRVEAAAALADGAPRIVAYTLLDPATGDPGVCGGEAELYLEPHMPNDLLIIGAGHIGRAVSELATWMGHRVTIWDDRPDALAAIPGGADVTRVGGTIDEAVAGVTVGTAIVVVTRDVGLDLRVLPVVLGSAAGFVGVMGSRRRWATTATQLAEAGVDQARIDAVHNPIGIEIGAETPEEIAVSVLAEVVAARRGAA